MYRRSFPDEVMDRLEWAEFLLIIVTSALLGLLTLDVIDKLLPWPAHLVGWAIMAISAMEIAFRAALEGGAFLRSFWSVFGACVLLSAGLMQEPAILVLRLAVVVHWFGLDERLDITIVLWRWAHRSARIVLRSLAAFLVGLYALSVVAVKLFGEVLETEFGTLAAALRTLLHIAVLEAHTFERLVSLAGHQPLVWALIILPWCMIFALALAVVNRVLLAEAVVEEEAEVVSESLSQMQLMQLETELVQEEMAVEAEAERVLIRVETDRILKEIRTLKDEMATYRQRYGR
ncbi:hypothetical protein [Roseibium sp.]|uniref:hypothetical protein n=1 Tax=Roseibium sp. TaxID=1936156 RepID=UPI003A968BEF